MNNLNLGTDGNSKKGVVWEMRDGSFPFAKTNKKIKL